MKKIAINEFPAIKVREGLKAQEITLDALASSGSNIATFGPREGDTIEFPENAAAATTFERQVRENNDSTEKLIGVLRNGKPDWFSVSALRRMNFEGKSHDAVCESLRTCQNDKERVEKLYGKTIVAGEMKPCEQYEFLNGTRLTTTKVRQFPTLAYA